MTYVLELSSVKLFHRKRVFMGIILSILITAVRLIWGNYGKGLALFSLSLSLLKLENYKIGQSALLFLSDLNWQSLGVKRANQLNCLKFKIMN